MRLVRVRRSWISRRILARGIARGHRPDAQGGRRGIVGVSAEPRRFGSIAGTRDRVHVLVLRPGTDAFAAYDDCAIRPCGSPKKERRGGGCARRARGRVRMADLDNKSARRRARTKLTPGRTRREAEHSSQEAVADDSFDSLADAGGEFALVAKTGVAQALGHARLSHAGSRRMLCLLSLICIAARAPSVLADHDDEAPPFGLFDFSRPFRPGARSAGRVFQTSPSNFRCTTGFSRDSSRGRARVGARSIEDLTASFIEATLNGVEYGLFHQGSDGAEVCARVLRRAPRRPPSGR